ncbi:MAG: hypothetical protein IH950_16295 [Bacteroidetes bacterium]|nr:hypothetical protein [Bacteroidota bacterium]
MPIKELQFPVLKKVEYIDLSVKGNTKLIVDGKDVEGMKWRDFQKYIGSKIPMDNYFYVLKLNDKPEVYKGRVKPIVLEAGVVSGDGEDGKTLLVLKESVSALSEKIEVLSKGNGVSMEMLLEATKQSFVMRIEFLGIELAKKDTEFSRLELKYNKLETDLDDADDEIEILRGKTGITQYIEIAKDFLQMKAGTLKGLDNLKDSNSSDIPPDITEVLGVINWIDVSPDIIEEIIHYLKIFATKLPLKGK